MLEADGRTAILGGTADVTNTSGEDWNGVQLLLAPHEAFDAVLDPDRDHDRIPDDLDQCPDAAETYNGTDDGDGCPDRGDMHVVATADDVLQGRIGFANGSALLRPPERARLALIVAVLAASPMLERLEVIDVVGSAAPEEPTKLAAARARAVVEALVAAGLSRELARPSVAIGPRKREGDLRLVELVPSWQPALDFSAVSFSAHAPPRTAPLKIGKAVHLARGKTMEVALPSRTIPAEKVAYLRAAPDGMKATMCDALWLPATEQPLALGAISIIDRADPTRPAIDRVVPWLDTQRATLVKLEPASALRAEVTASRTREPLSASVDRLVVTTRFVVHAGTPAPRRAFLGLPQRKILRPRALPDGTIIAADGYHLPLALTPGAAAELVLVEEAEVEATASRRRRERESVRP